jgi:hypothetical protein
MLLSVMYLINQCLFSDRTSKAEESPWEETEDITLKAFCRTDEDLLLNFNLNSSIDVEDYKFEV